jgi:iron complex outermembrane receptor protein
MACSTLLPSEPIMRARTLLTLLLLLIGAGTSRADEATSESARAQAKAHFTVGAAHYAAARYNEAIVEYQAAYDLLPLPDMLFNLAQCYKMKGNAMRAIEYYSRFLATAPSGRASEEAKRSVAALQPLAAAEEQAARAAAKAEAAARAAAQRDAAAREAARRDAAQREAERREQERLAKAKALVEAERQRKKEAPRPLYRRWWLWTIAGVVVAGAAAGIGAGVSTRAKDPVPSQQWRF